MIFITVGTERYPFNRLIKEIDLAVGRGIISNKVFGQIGPSTYTPVHYDYRRFLPYNEMMDYIIQADVVVSHAGIGSILSCLRHNKIPILFPRSRRYKEHIDNHQVDFMKSMVAKGKLLWAASEDDLIQMIINVKNESKAVDETRTYNKKNQLVLYLKKVINDTITTC